MVFKLLVTKYKMLASPVYLNCQKVQQSSVLLQLRRQGGVSYLQSRQVFGLQSSRKFPLSPISFLSPICTCSVLLEGVFCTRDSRNMQNASVEMFLDSNTPWKYTITFIYQNLQFIFIGKVGNSI
uniref:Uncharacterized protein n=1 Tax=Rousettus aegyptiacus TaxID=9407 RepID=A0A7J8KBJ3_ROUAE|nr:hypothetical protein HJG63_008002 [Rousettus aegyptiacus]